MSEWVGAIALSWIAWNIFALVSVSTLRKREYDPKYSHYIACGVFFIPTVVMMLVCDVLKINYNSDDRAFLIRTVIFWVLLVIGVYVFSSYQFHISFGISKIIAN